MERRERESAWAVKGFNEGVRRRRDDEHQFPSLALFTESIQRVGSVLGTRLDQLDETEAAKTKEESGKRVGKDASSFGDERKKRATNLSRAS